eukprot:scaffold10121_cov112-Isochrysis_galbana.AAC.8
MSSTRFSGWNRSRRRCMKQLGRRPSSRCAMASTRRFWRTGRCGAGRAVGCGGRGVKAAPDAS